MAADLHIHVAVGLENGDLEHFFAGTLGSKWFQLFAPSCPLDCPRCMRVLHTPNVWIGEVSWLKADLFEDEDSFIPDSIDAIREIIGEDLPILDENLIEQILAAMRLPNRTQYNLNDEESVRKFLEAHLGQPLFTISW